MIVLVGFMGAGKTTVGHLLSERLGLPFIDSDLVIEQQTGRSVREIFAADGEPAFRDLEQRVVAELIDGPGAVLALGGGAAEHQETIKRLKSAQVIYLKVGYGEAMLRVAGDQYRPLLSRPDLESLYRHRLSVYEGVATLTVATDGRRPEAVSQDVLAQLVGGPASAATAARPGADSPGNSGRRPQEFARNGNSGLGVDSQPHAPGPPDPAARDVPSPSWLARHVPR